MIAERSPARRMLCWMLAALAVTAIAGSRGKQPARSPVASTPTFVENDAEIRRLRAEIERLDREIERVRPCTIGQ